MELRISRLLFYTQTRSYTVSDRLVINRSLVRLPSAALSSNNSGQISSVMELVNIYHSLSCSFVEIKRLYVVSVCIN